MSNRYRILISTDSGSVREANEDNFIFNGTIKRPGDEAQHFRARDTGEPILCAVFDGMGGEKGGKAASEIAARVALKFYEYLAEGNQSCRQYSGLRFKLQQPDQPVHGKV